MAGKLGWRLGVALTLSGAVAACLMAVGDSGAMALVASRSSASHSSGAGAGQPRSRSVVPWRKVGPGWILAEYWPGRLGIGSKPKAASAFLYLFDPDGGRYQLYRWPVSKYPPVLVDWSADKTRALVSMPSGRVELIKLATGGVSRFRLPARTVAAALSRPGGREVLTWSSAGAGVRIASYHLNGRLDSVLVSGALSASFVSSPSGVTFAVGAAHGLWLVGRDGGVLRRISVPQAKGGCIPVRWWSSSVVLASCNAAKAVRARLWLVPANGASPVLLIANSDKNSHQDELDAWRTRSGVFVQAVTRSGQGQILREAPKGRLVAVTLGGTLRDDWIVAARGSRLLIRAGKPGSGSRSLLWLDPVTGQQKVLIKSSPGLTGVVGTVPYGQPVAHIYMVRGGS